VTPSRAGLRLLAGIFLVSSSPALASASPESAGAAGVARIEQAIASIGWNWAPKNAPSVEQNVASR
jgi:hypothetical protein